jgi:hypothetical protein
MKLLLNFKAFIPFIIGLLMTSIGCMSQTESLPEVVPREINPETPSYEILSKNITVEFNSLSEEVTNLDKMRTTRVYSLNGERYSGWAYQEFFDSEHRHRFTLFYYGSAVWQIGYFQDLDLGHDFHMKDGYNYGSQKMWNNDGGLYIDTYFLEKEIQHGIQKRWSGRQLVRDALFDKGSLIYDVSFDGQGNIMKIEGTLPSDYPNQTPK